MWPGAFSPGAAMSRVNGCAPPCAALSRAPAADAGKSAADIGVEALMGRGIFITFEGTEGSGKTTQVELLGEWLVTHDPVVVREPGGTELGERIREVVLYAGLDIDAEAEMYLFMAARRQLIAEVIVPALAANQVVIADRYHDSTLAYQGGARGVPAIWPLTFPRPDITFLLEGPVETGLERHTAAGKEPDRMEKESIEFHQKVAAAYEKLADADPARFVRLDARESREKVHMQVKERLTPLISALLEKT
jgi:dTMP kinase